MTPMSHMMKHHQHPGVGFIYPYC